MTKIGIIGLGIVGSACKFGFELLGHEVIVHDIKLDTKLEDLLECQVIFVCVPTPSNDDGSCDTSIVESVIDDYVKIKYYKKMNYFDQIIAIKSTVPPGTTEKIKQKHTYLGCKLSFAFVPEFLREHSAITDFTEHQDVCIIGTQSLETFNIIKELHGKFPRTFVHLSTQEAEASKLFNNAFNAMRITFANSFYEMCNANNINYTNVKNAIVNVKHIPDNYLNVNKSFRGFGGPCLGKDLKSLIHLTKDTNVELFKDILKENDKYETTLVPGMRKK